jgi:hypothetical protein
MIHYEKQGNYYVLLGIGYSLYCFSLSELIKQAKDIYNINLLTVLN